MANLTQTIISSGMAGTCLLAIVSSVYRPSYAGPRNHFLTGLFVLLLLHALGELFMSSGAYRVAPQLVGIQLPILMLMGPTMFLYASSLMSTEPIKPLRTYSIALLGPILIVLVMLPFHSLPIEQRVSLANPETRDPELFKFAVLTCLTIATIFVAFTAAYTLAALRIQKKHKIAMMQKFSDIETRSVDWLRVMLLLWLVVWLLYGLDKVTWAFNIRPNGMGTLLALAEALTMIPFAHLALTQKALPEPVKEPKNEPNKTREASLPKERMERIAKKLRTEMTENQLYADNDLSLRQLSDAIKTSENHISETFSKYLQTNFFQFVNEYRIEAAKEMLSTTDDSVTTVVYAVGYNSRSTFNSAFKRETGFTPTAFRQQHLALTSD